MLRISTALLSAALLMVLAAPLDSSAAQKRRAKVQHVSKKKSAGTAKFEKGSGETASERDRRLLRECKGRPNSGACMGYTG